jgi:Leucine-rich repeat (LRR) protein
MRANNISGDMTTFRDPVHMNTVQKQQLSALTRLKYIKLLENQITNISPTISWSLFDQLQEIDFSENLLQSSSFMAGMNALESVIEINLAQNQIIGTIPTTAFANDQCGVNVTLCSYMGALQTLDLHDNFLNGTIPATLFYLSSLSTIDITENSFSGLPSSFVLPQNILAFDMSNNNLTGTIPSSLFTCGGSQCEILVLRFRNNALTGTIPITIGDLPQIREIDFNNNQLSGTIPEAIGRLGTLKILNLGSNSLQLTLPETIDFLDQLSHLDISDNLIESPLPETLTGMTALTFANLSSNNFTEFSDSLGHWSNLVVSYRIHSFQFSWIAIICFSFFFI